MVNFMYKFLKYHGRKLVLPADEMKREIEGVMHGVKNVLDFGSGTLFWSKYFAEKFDAKVFAADISYGLHSPHNGNPNISLHGDILKTLPLIPADEKNAVFICDVIHHLTPDFWKEILPELSALFDVIIIKDIDSKYKFGNFCSALHDRIINFTNFENVYPLEIEHHLLNAGFDVKITKMHKLWYPHFMLTARSHKCLQTM
jgi:SAM-dependent methyltransferase